MDITFRDPKDIANYYNINVYLKCFFANGESLYFPLSYYSDDMIFHTGNDMSLLGDDRNYLKSRLFNDDLLDGKEYKLKIKTNSYNYYNYDNSEVVRNEILVELQSLSPSYYMFQKTLEASNNTDGFMEYFSEPVQIYTNVKGGIGILGSYSSSFYTIPLK